MATRGAFGLIRDAKTLDRFQPPTLFDADLNAYKEWQHFNVFDRRAHLFALLNFAVSGNPFDPKTGMCARIAVTRHRGGEIIGGIEPETVERLHFSYLKPGIGLPGVSVTFRDNVYRVVCVMEGVRIRADLAFTIAAVPLTTLTKPFGSGFLGWTVFPRMTVNGTIAVSNRTYRIRNAAGYHDHDWGRFYWGEPVGWNWGIFMEGRSSGVTLVFDQATSGLGTRPEQSELLVYQGQTLAMEFANDDLSVEFDDEFRDQPLVFPGVMRLTHHRASAPVPKRVKLTGKTNGGGKLQVIFVPEVVVQLIAPNHLGAGETLLNQVFGRIDIRNSIRGITIFGPLDGYMEFVGPNA